MKISTGQLFERAVTQMNTQQSAVAKMQAQLASGKQIVQASDDPDKVGLIQRLNTASQRQDVYEQSLNTVNGRLVAEEASIVATDNILQRVRELAVRASSDTLSAPDREIISIEVSALKESLMQLANTQDINGNYVFAGSMSNTVPYTEDTFGQVSYNGDDRHIAVDVSEQRRLTMNRPGSEVFDSVVRKESDGSTQRVGFFGVIEDFASALKNNDTDGIQRSLSEVSDLSASVSVSLADVGSRLSVVDSQRDMLSDAKLRYQMLLSQVEDLDYATAVTELSAELLSMEAAQSSFAKISQLSLFDYIR
ncbi:flagellar hook-associated protein FlgL [Porticoccaceae bacterium]|nr:flagellar hook-associated protein FlgL [Porticoccaceae bacterium]MDB4308961.1 flagellar hook-associated protein FlgL [Porticoccaceae bacterium]MDB9999592.1 flagellar hook-associated protein FlgL [Porticoccaceae bacterium]